MATTRERLHELLDALPEELLDDAEAAIAALTVPYRPLSEAPEDDEPLTDAEIVAFREGREEYLRGELIPHDQAVREIGL